MSHHAGLMNSPPSPAMRRSGAAAEDRPGRFLGVLAALVTIGIWGGWIVATRFAVTTSLTPYDVAFLRYAIPAVVLLPVLLREGLAIRRIGLGPTLAMVAGAGVPFLLVSSTGMRFAPAADIGALLPGTMPLFVALFVVLFFGERFDRLRLTGFALVGGGVLCVGGYTVFVAESGAWRGHLLFFAAAAMWAVYTLALRRSGIGAFHAVALISFYSTVAYAPVYLLFLEPRLVSVPPEEVLVQAVCQGLMSGVVASFTYGVAIRRLGASQAAVFSALTPVVSALLAWPLLGEIPSAATMIGIAAVGSGVALASGAFAARRIAP